MSTRQRSDVNSISEDTAIDPNAVCESDEEHIDEAYTEGNVSEFGDMNCTYQLSVVVNVEGVCNSYYNSTQRACTDAGVNTSMSASI